MDVAFCIIVEQLLSTKSGCTIFVEGTATVALGQIPKRPAAMGTGDPPSLQLASQDRFGSGGAGIAVGASTYIISLRIISRELFDTAKLIIFKAIGIEKNSNKATPQILKQDKR